MDLMQTMLSKGYDEVELCGVVSNICVLSNAVLIKTALPEARVVVDAQAVGSGDLRLNEEALDILSSVQVDVINRR